jgi:hypothetical protein
MVYSVLFAVWYNNLATIFDKNGFWYFYHKTASNLYYSTRTNPSV